MDLDERALFPDPPRAPRRVRRREPTERASTSASERRVIAAAAGLAAVLALLGTSEPSGYPIADALLQGGFAALVTLAASRSKRWTWLWLPIVALVAADSAVALGAALAGLVAALAVVVTDRRRRVFGAVIGALAVQALVRLPALDPYGLSALAVSVAVVPVFVSAYVISPRRVRRRIHQGLAVALGFVVLGAALAGLAAALAAGDVNRAVASAREGFDAVQEGDDDKAGRFLTDAADEFGAGQSKVGSWWVAPATLVPGVSQHLLALDVATAQGEQVSRSGAEVASTVDVDTLRFESGAIDLGQVRAVGPPLARSADTLAVASDELARVDYPWLLDPLVERLGIFRDEVDGAAPDAALAAEVAAVGPAILGGDGERRYVVIFTQPAESRGLGGFMGNWAELTAVDGDLELTRSGRTEEIRDTPGLDQRTIDGPEDYYLRYRRFEPWKVLQDVTLSPDFPSVADVMAQVYPQTGGGEVDGVLAVDPYALAALMEFTGPIDVAGLDMQLNSENAAEFLLRDQYLEFQEDESNRQDFLDEASRETFEELTTGDIPGPREVADTLDAVVDAGRLAFWTVRPEEQEVIDSIGIDDAVTAGRGDYFSLVTQNSANNKIDVFLERSVTYRATVDPDTDQVSATATIELTNAVPSLDLPDAVVGSNDQGLPRGTNEVWLNFYTPLRFVSATVDGERQALGTEREFDLWVYNQFFEIPPGETLVVELELTGVIPFDDDEYRLVVGNQPMVNPDVVTVEVDTEPGWEMAEVTGVDAEADRSSAAAVLDPLRDQFVGIRFRPN